MRMSLLSLLLFTLAGAGVARAQAGEAESPSAADEAMSSEGSVTETATPSEADANAEVAGEDDPAPGRAGARRHDRPASIRIRTDASLRWAPRWVLAVRETEVGAVQRFWHRVDELPLTVRVALDGDRLAGGRVGVHLATWGALDLTVDT